MRTCKYPDKQCADRYLSARNNHGTPICRLDEWKKKIGVCPYNKQIHSTIKTYDTFNQRKCIKGLYKKSKKISWETKK